MKKNLIVTSSIAVVIALCASYFYLQNKEAKKKLIVTQPFAIAALRESLEQKHIGLEAACTNPGAVTKDIIDLSSDELKTRFTYLCEDMQIAKRLEENFATNTDYKYFLDCAKSHTANMMQMTNDLKAHYPEDYKNLNFSKDNQEAILLKYLKHPNSAYLMAQCEAKTEALYWRSIINSGKVEDLKFCLQTTEDCMGGKSKSEECPANLQNYHDECSKKLNKMKH
jgi:hypothetical protein